MSSEREERMAAILQRLCEWETQSLDTEPRVVLKTILEDAKETLENFGFPLYRDPSLPYTKSDETP